MCPPVCCAQNKHCILDVGGNAIKRLHAASIFPISVYVRPCSFEWLVATSKRQTDDTASRRVFERCSALESEFQQLFTGARTATALAEHYFCGSAYCIGTQLSLLVFEYEDEDEEPGLLQICILRPVQRSCDDHYVRPYGALTFIAMQLMLNEALHSSFSLLQVSSELRKAQHSRRSSIDSNS